LRKKKSGLRAENTGKRFEGYRLDREGTSMPAGHKSTSARLMRFSSSGGDRTSNVCAIDAHGAQLPGERFTVPEGVTIKFYVAEGETLVTHTKSITDEATGSYHYATATKAIAKDTATEVENFAAGTSCPNYFLQKMHKSKNNKSNSDRNQIIGYEELDDFLDKVPGCCDIITVRHRIMKSDITLREIVEELKGDYIVFRCAFCRASASPGTAAARSYVKGSETTEPGRLYTRD
jgi:hypothetical protein